MGRRMAGAPVHGLESSRNIDIGRRVPLTLA